MVVMTSLEQQGSDLTPRFSQHPLLAVMQSCRAEKHGRRWGYVALLPPLHRSISSSQTSSHLSLLHVLYLRVSFVRTGKHDLRLDWDKVSAVQITKVCSKYVYRCQPGSVYTVCAYIQHMSSSFWYSSSCGRKMGWNKSHWIFCVSQPWIKQGSRIQTVPEIEKVAGLKIAATLFPLSLFHLLHIFFHKTTAGLGATLQPRLCPDDRVKVRKTAGRLCRSSSHPSILPRFLSLYLCCSVHPLLVNISAQCKQRAAQRHWKFILTCPADKRADGTEGVEEESWCTDEIWIWVMVSRNCNYCTTQLYASITHRKRAVGLASSLWATSSVSQPFF